MLDLTVLCFFAITDRRSSYHDVIRVNEIQKVLDITGVKTYIINSARVVVLNERPQPSQGKDTCEVCDRSLLDSFRFCSLGCKIVGTSSNFRRKKQHLGKAFDDEESYSSSHGNGKNKVQSFTPSTPLPTVVNYRTANRRKGIPHRTPMGGLKKSVILCEANYVLTGETGDAEALGILHGLSRARTNKWVIEEVWSDVDVLKKFFDKLLTLWPRTLIILSDEMDNYLIYPRFGLLKTNSILENLKSMAYETLSGMKPIFRTDMACNIYYAI
ncbi:uncharacterized protein LOC122092910 [Macadamia integrifolia]|uniref:uncharacterized protein LOC122092910 n=1 Tax=Macadamia integrifolia TaxID=60698 RepID=UPI001C533118|nr:uncharacterized protein LOC122092910 [Macadamia integrifolia]